MQLRPLLSTALLALAGPAFALNILVSNDDGLTSNLKALYEALKAQGHDVIVSVPCSGQSGRGAAIVMYSTTVIVADNDKTQIDAEGGCHNGAAATGEPAVGPFTKSGYTGGDYQYPSWPPCVGWTCWHRRAGTRPPTLCSQAPMKARTLARSSTARARIGNAQFAAGRGLPAIALSAGTDTTDNTGLASPHSAVVGQLTVQLIKALQANAGTGALLPNGVALNVNFPNAPTTGMKWSFSRHGSFDLYNLKFKNTVPYGLGYTLNSTDTATAAQAEDESIVYKTRIAVTAMQVGFDQRPAGQQWLRLRLRDLLSQQGS